MENPNTGGVTIRRHHSLPSYSSRRTTRTSPRPPRTLTYRRNHLSHHGSNPYVGWFRHSPPITSLRHDRHSISWSDRTTHNGPHEGGTRTRPILSHARDDMALCRYKDSYHQTSPYVGWFRHAPPSGKQGGTTLCWDLLAYEFVKSAWKSSSSWKLSDLLASGHLLGGSPRGNDDMMSSHPLATPSITALILRRFASWMLSGQDSSLSLKCKQQEDSSVCCSSSDDPSTDMDGHDDVSSTCSSDIVPASPDRQHDPSSSVHMQLSSHAQAYHAHATVVAATNTAKHPFPTLRSCRVYEEDQTSSSTSTTATTDFQRLDYNITQMDIVRMTRNASRHLDVESILQLPSVTYNPTLKTTSSKDDEDSSGSEEEWSWLMVSQQQQQGHQENNKTKRDETATCVICLEAFQPGDRLRVLPCNHSFHMGCVDPWLSGSLSFEECYTAGCPTCKKHPCKEDPQEDDIAMDGSVPSWAFERLGSVLAQESAI